MTTEIRGLLAQACGKHRRKTMAATNRGTALAAEVRGLLQMLELHLVLLHQFWHCRVPSKLFENHLKQLCNYHCQMISTQ